MDLIDTRGAGNQGALIAIVLLVLALFAVFFLWQREENDADIEVDLGGAAMAFAIDAPDEPSRGASRDRGP